MLNSYLKDMKRVKVLDSKELQELILEFNSTDSDLVKDKTRNRILKGSHALMFYATQIATAGNYDLTDINTALIALNSSIDNYNVDLKKTKFSSYAINNIIFIIRRAKRSEKNIIKIPDYHLDNGNTDLSDLEGNNYFVNSLDELSNCEGDKTIQISDNTNTYEEACHNVIIEELSLYLKKKLKPFHYEVYCLRLQNKTEKEIGDMFGKTRAAVSLTVIKIERAIKKYAEFSSLDNVLERFRRYEKFACPIT